MSELTRRLKETGSAGLLAYGILNTVYYTLAVTVAWISTDGGLRLLPALGQASSGGLAGGVTRFIKVLALAWAGSQVTKIFRLGGAVLLAPATGSLLDRVQERLKLGSRGQAVRVVVVGLLSFTAMVFSLLILQGSFTYSLVAPAAAAMIAQAGPERNAPRMNVKALGAMGALGVAGTLLRRRVVVSASAGAETAAVETAPAPASAAKPAQEGSAPGPKKERGGSARQKKGAAAGPNAKAKAKAKAEGGEGEGEAAPVQVRRKRGHADEAPPNPNIHGWDAHPNHLRGKWRVTSVKFSAVAEELGQDEFDAFRDGFKAAVLRGGGKSVLREGRGNGELNPGGWEFTPANKRLVLEVAAPERGLVLRFTGEVRRRPKHWCRAEGVIRMRPLDVGPLKPGRAVPSTDRSWPKVGEMSMERVMTPPTRLGKWDRVLVWTRLEVPPFKNTKAGRKAKAFLEEGEEKGPSKSKEWNARALKYQMWKYFPAAKSGKGGKQAAGGKEN